MEEQCVGHCRWREGSTGKNSAAQILQPDIQTWSSWFQEIESQSASSDEFVRCSRCNKARRFRLRTKEECRIHHDALANEDWKCADLPYDRLACEDDEERTSRWVYRGCSRTPTCKGCTSCVCFGCEICRFADCSCQTCTDFTRNAKV